MRGLTGEWFATSRAAFCHGAFRLGPLRKGEYALFVIPSNGELAFPAGVHEPGREPLEIAVPKLGSVLGVAAPMWTLAGSLRMRLPESPIPEGTIIRVVCDASDSPERGARGFLLPGVPRTQECPVGKDGRFEFELLPHMSFMVEARAPGMQPARANVDTKQPGQGRADFTLTLRPGVNIEVTIKGRPDDTSVTARCLEANFFDQGDLPRGGLYHYPPYAALDMAEIQGRPGVFRVNSAPDGCLVELIIRGPGIPVTAVKSIRATLPADGSAQRIDWTMEE